MFIVPGNDSIHSSIWSTLCRQRTRFVARAVSDAIGRVEASQSRKLVDSDRLITWVKNSHSNLWTVGSNYLPRDSCSSTSAYTTYTFYQRER